MADETTSTGTANSEGTQPGVEPKAGGKTFTQAELDRAVGERVVRERAKLTKDIEERESSAVARFREEHGLDDDALSEWAQRDKAAAAARALKSDATKARNEYEKTAARLKVTQAKLDEVLRTGAIISAAAGKCHDPEVVVALLGSRVRMNDDFSVVVLDEKGEPTTSTVDDAVKQLLESKPYLVPASGRFAGSGARGGEPMTSSAGGSDKELLTREGRLERLRKIAG